MAEHSEAKWHADDAPPMSRVDIKLRLGDREYIASVLLDVFGSDGKNVIVENILHKPAVFGGPCDWYQQVRIGANPNDLADPEKKCPLGKFSMNLPMIGESNILREALLIKSCNQLISNPNTFNFALNKILAGAQHNKINPKHVQAALSLFYPERHAPEELISELSKLTEKDASALSWKKILYVLCIDPAWQLI